MVKGRLALQATVWTAFYMVVGMGLWHLIGVVGAQLAVMLAVVVGASLSLVAGWVYEDYLVHRLREQRHGGEMRHRVR